MPAVFSLPPAPPRALWTMAAIAVALLLPLLLFGYIAYAGSATRYEVSDSGLRISRTLYGRTLAWNDLVVTEARPIDLASEREYQPRLRTNGVGLPGYQAGWFSTRGRGKALVFITDRSRVVAVPTRRGYTLLLSVDDPARFVERLREQGEETG